MDEREQDRTARWRSRAGGYLWPVLAVVLLATAFQVLPHLDVGSVRAGDDRAAALPQERDEDGEPRRPTRELVLQLRDELYAAAVDNPDYPIDPARLEAVATAPREYTPLGRIGIPGLGLDVEFAAGVHPSVLERGPGHWPGTVRPGQPGNAVLSGHRTTHTHPFKELDALRRGDAIVVDNTGGGAPVAFRVTETVIVPEAATGLVLREPTDPAVGQLTLFACHPEGDRTHRIVVRAHVEEGV